MKKTIRQRWLTNLKEEGKRIVAATLAVAMLVSSCPLEAQAQTPGLRPATRPVQRPSVPENPAETPSPETVRALPDSIPPGEPATVPDKTVGEEEISAVGGKPGVTQESDTLSPTADDTLAIDSLLTAAAESKEDEWVPREVEFSPDPTKAVWMSALFPGLGQVYNRRYWKLPIIVGGYLGLAYATSWNNDMLRDYTLAYSDLLDNDPNTKSYMDLFSPNVKEESLDRAWLQNVIKSRKNYFRRNRDLCIICMVGVYLLAMVDAYVDASLSHFDISPDLSMDVAPSLIQDGRQRYPSVGLVWALNF